MYENYNHINEDEKMLSLTGLCVYVLKKWKIMLLVAGILAVLAGTVFTIKDYQEYKVNQGAEQQVSNKKIVSETVESSVLAKMETIDTYRRTIKTYEYYYENSIKAKLDPNNIYEGAQEYLFSAATVKELLMAISICEEEIFADKNFEKLLQNLSEPTTIAMLKEVMAFTKEHVSVESKDDIYTIVDDTDLIFRVTIRHYDEEECNKIQNYIGVLMDGLKQTLDSKNVDAKVVKISTNVNRCVDRSMPALSKEIRAAIVTLYDNISTIETKMSDEESGYYKYLLKENAKTETSVSTAQKDVSPLEFVNVVMIVIGAFAGAVCVAVFYVLLYMAGGFVHSKEELKSWLKIPVADVDAGTDMLAAFLGGVVYNKDIKKIYLTGTLEQLNTVVMEQVKEKISAGGCEVVVGNSILKDAKALQEAANCGSVILFEKCNVSKEKDVKEAILKATSCGINVLSIVLEK